MKNTWDVKAQERSRKRLDYFKEYRELNKGRYNEHAKSWARKKRIALLMFMGGKCTKCRYDDWRALQIDHVNGRGEKERKTTNSWKYYLMVAESYEKQEGKYQILCSNCNWIKRYEKNELEGRVRRRNG